MAFITNSLLKCECSHDTTSGAASESRSYSTLLVSVAHDRQSLCSLWRKEWETDGLLPPCELTAIIAECSKLDSLLGIAGAVVDFHLQLVPGGLLQVVEDVALGEGGALCRGPSGRVYRPILQGERGDRASAVIPAVQVELDSSGIDASEELLFFRVLRFCGKKEK